MSVLENLGWSVAFGFVGILVLAVGYWIFDRLIPLDFNKELEKNNISVAIVIASLLISIAIIVAVVVKA